MNREKSILIVLCLEFLALTIGVSSLSASTLTIEQRHTRVSNPAVIAVVEKVMGINFYTRGALNTELGAKRPFAMGFKFLERDRLYSEKSRAHTRYKDGTFLELGEESSIECEKMRFKNGDFLDEATFRFYYGFARFVVPNVTEKQRFTVKTANAIMVVVDPSEFFILQAPGERDLELAVLRGKIEFINIITNERMSVGAGGHALLKVTGAVLAQPNLSIEQIAALKARSRL